MIFLKTDGELEVMRENGAILAEILAELVERAVPGETTAALDRLAERRIRESGAEPAMRTKKGRTAVEIAMQEGHDHVVAVLREAGHAT